MDSLGDFATGMGRSIQVGAELGKRDRIQRMVWKYTITRSCIALDDREKGLIRGMAAACSDGSIPKGEFQPFLDEMTWAGGAGTLMAPGSIASDNQEPIARGVLVQILKQLLVPYPQFQATVASRLALTRHSGRPSAAAIARFLNQGNAWFDVDGPFQSDTFTPTRSPSNLLIGFAPGSGTPISYGGNESLITIAGPGTGKSQVQVIRNLLSYPGSAFVLDVKGELWDSTAGYRQKHFGPVYRFAPTDPAGNSNAYNPFDFVASDPEQAAVDCELISTQIIPPKANAKDPFWDNRARDFLWAFTLATALGEVPERRNLATVMEMLSVPVSFEEGASDRDYLKSPTPAMIMRLKNLAQKYGVVALAQTAVAIESGLSGTRTDSVFESARQHLTIFSRSRRLRAAMGHSDWSPLTLRRNPGTTVYLCLSGDDIDTYIPIVRIILQQHANLLLREFPPPGTQLPVTFFLDEFPQLGRMESIQRLLDVGRGAGLRLWLFAQYVGQLQEAYEKRADGLVNACRVRCFMQPDNDAVRLLTPQLGKVQHLFSGKEKPLAEEYELMGAAYADKIIVTARGHDPVLLGKRYAYHDLRREMEFPPPVVRRSSV
jgi:type IV secretion system protein VirD4